MRMLRLGNAKIAEHSKQILQAKNIMKEALVSINFENRTEREVQFNL